MSDIPVRIGLVVALLLVGVPTPTWSQSLNQGETVAAANAVSDPAGNLAWGVIAGGASGLSASGNAVLETGVVFGGEDPTDPGGSGPPTLGFPPGSFGGGGGGCAAGGPSSPAAALPLVLLGVFLGFRCGRPDAGAPGPAAA